MRLIDADTLSKSIKDGDGTPIQKFFADVCVMGASTVDAEPVVHGRWIPERHKDRVSQTEYHSYIWYHCSECGRRLIGYRDPREAPYCHCGAKMDLRGEDNDGTEKA